MIYLYSNVEKIKTIGSTFMAASGMNPSIRQVNQILILMIQKKKISQFFLKS